MFAFAPWQDFVGQLMILFFGTGCVDDPEYDISLIQLLEAPFDT